MTTKRRKSLRGSQFGLPGKRKFPIDTRARAANAKARATQQLNKGNITRAERDRIFARADRVLKKKKRSK